MPELPDVVVYIEALRRFVASVKSSVASMQLVRGDAALVALDRSC